MGANVDKSLVVVANRLPVERINGNGDWQPSPGGLVSALGAGDPAERREVDRVVGRR